MGRRPKADSLQRDCPRGTSIASMSRTRAGAIALLVAVAHGQQVQHGQQIAETRRVAPAAIFELVFAANERELRDASVHLDLAAVAISALELLEKLEHGPA